MNAEQMEHEISRIRRRLQKQLKRECEDASVILKYFSKLKLLPMTPKLLKSSRISDTVNEYRKAKTHEVVSHEAKKLIKHWRNLVSDSSSTTEKSQPMKKYSPAHESAKSKTLPSANSASTTKTTDKKANSFNELRQKEKPKVKRQVGKSSSASRAQKSNSQKAKKKTNSNSISSGTSETDRIKCCELLEKALLAKDGPTPNGDRVALAVACANRIEAALFVDCGSSVSARYRTRIISRVQNLKDARNPELREAVLRGEVPAEKFACMKSEEMASPELRKQREKLESEAIDGSRMAFTTGTKSTLLKCKRCNKESVSYNQMQTLSSDEPMTTFCFCNECGYRWKFF